MLTPWFKEEIVAGNRRARKLAIELAWLWVRHQPDSELSCWFRRRVGDMRGRLRRVAIVALARKRMAALWRYLQTRRGADRRRAASEPLNGRAQ
jgi:hypothetical protein